ncbi:MAG: class I SAM-dependent methyltransferase [Alphaproteobacteria bacterium]|nr:class I SAM-dependent methyltransferase [Alphaproteobacteria bacterium]
MTGPADTLAVSGGTGAKRRGARFSLARRFLARLATQVEHGQLLIQTPAGETLQRVGPRPGPSATLTLARWRAVRRLLLGGDIGFAEAYMDGDWSTPDLAALIELAARNHRTMYASLNGSRLARWANRLGHLRSANTRRGSRRNIPAHYDLGNEFYAAWLDAGMTYSSGLYADARTSLEEAQAAKQDLAIEALAPREGQSVLEIGCGWGGLAERLARERGCRVTGLTLSPAQLAYARERMADLCASGRADLRLEDYRDCTGTFDRIVSIEMLEAVGREYWPAYFATIRDRLRRGGIAALQVITMAEDRYAAYERGADFIQRHVFPGGMLPSDSVMRAQIAAAGLRLDHVTRFGASYARTLGDWQTRFQSAWPRLRAMGLDLRFKRKWEYYLAYCEAGFRAGAIDVGLYRVRRPGPVTEAVRC